MRSHKNHWPARSHKWLASTCSLLNAADFVIGPVQSSVERGIQIFSSCENRLVAVPCKQGQQFFIGHGAVDGGIGDFIAIQVQDGQDRAGFGRIKKLVAMPGGSGRSGLRLAIADDAGHNQIGIIHGSAKGGRQRIAQFSSFVNGSWNTRIEVTWKSAGPGKAAHKFFNPDAIERQVWIEFTECSFYIKVCQVCGSSMPRTRDQKQINVVALDEMIEVSIDQVDARAGPPVS